VAHIDAFVDRPDGSSWASTIFTVMRSAACSHGGGRPVRLPNGSNFWAVDQLLVPEPAVRAMMTAIREPSRRRDSTRRCAMRGSGLRAARAYED
jgi:hypothetical protein